MEEVVRSIYESELHRFAEAYFKAEGARIGEKCEEYFIVLYPEGHRKMYTYIPRVAAENREMLLLAKGSRYLKEMVQKCASRSAFSHVKMMYTDESVKCSLTPKKCCDLCPFTAICRNKSSCCNFCYNYKNCNTHLENADYAGLGKLVETQPMDLICFIFTIQLSNDYSLSQNIEKSATVVIDLKTGQILDGFMARDFINLQIEASEGIPPGVTENYAALLAAARQGAEEQLQEQLEIFKREVEGPLKGKITAILEKTGEEYSDNYARFTEEQLKQFQEEAIKLCEREIRGYTINCSFHLKNVMVLHTQRDIQEIIFQHRKTGGEIIVKGNVLLTRLDLKCSQCGNELDQGVLCGQGHILCQSCGEYCSSCKKVICDVCEEDSVHCTTCGEPLCTGCDVKCSSCGTSLCAAHAYTCATCGNSYCIDCYEVCDICGDNVCGEHHTRCSQCGEPACGSHSHSCSVCGNDFCSNHISSCALCGAVLCEEHAHISASSARTVCDRHKVHCSVCEDLFAADEAADCSECGDSLCPSHTRACSKCGRNYCSKHIGHCRICGKDLCSCTSFKTCQLCGEEFCADCLNSKGYCKACAHLHPADGKAEKVERLLCQLPVLEKFNRFYLGEGAEIMVLYAKGVISHHIAVFNHKEELIGSHEVSFMGEVKRMLGKGR